MMTCDFAEEQRTSSIIVRSESPALDDEYAVSVSRIPVLNAGEITPKSPIEKAQQRLATLKQEYTSDAHLRFIVHPRNSAPIERDTFQSVLELLLPE
ncbi:hypothetical protein [Burkholderia lata]|uniref:hypothetical protein n=1 Tax=Burkholderia lata (strain ATCC 17760 / DSM 23089 / LMG 22485 / NCIMB 9086 / R18194 / 383) TaxID=482957 RepID=UPI0012E99704|nr:hypothetical protein [Burkholderia lata]